MTNLEDLEKILGIKFKKKLLLKTALTHSSYLNEHQEDRDSYERMEFLGDAVLEFVVSKYIFDRFCNVDEGRLTEIRAALVRTETLAHCAKKINLGSFVYLSNGEEQNQGRENQNLLADTLEALIAAIYLDQGIAVVQKFFEKYVKDELQVIVDNKLYIDPKSEFQELIQEKHKITPQYRLLKKDQADKSGFFEIGVYILDKLIATGTGKNKKLAEHEAAKNALHKLNNL